MSAGAEVEGPEATSAAVRTPVAVLGQAAELIQKIESDLQQAREAVVPGLDTQKLKQNLGIQCAKSGHSCTRQWVGLESDKSAVSSDEQELRQELEFQQKVTEALDAYGKEALCPEFSALHRALRSLVTSLREGASAVKPSLQAHGAQLMTCAQKVKEVDEARALQKHYEDKVTTLDEEVKRKGSPALQSKESLRACWAKRSRLREISDTWSSTLSGALQTASALARPAEPPAGYADALNPFTDDLLNDASPASAHAAVAPAAAPAPETRAASSTTPPAAVTAAVSVAVPELGVATNPFDAESDREEEAGEWKQLESESENSTGKAEKAHDAEEKRKAFGSVRSFGALSAHLRLVDSKASAPARDEGAGTPRALPPLAAMKVMASPRLQRLSMTPRLQPGGPRHWAWVVWTVIIGKAYVDQSHQMGGL
eukprot:g20368.t1